MLLREVEYYSKLQLSKLSNQADIKNDINNIRNNSYCFSCLTSCLILYACCYVIIEAIRDKINFQYCKQTAGDSKRVKDTGCPINRQLYKSVCHCLKLNECYTFYKNSTKNIQAKLALVLMFLIIKVFLKCALNSGSKSVGNESSYY